MRDQESDRKAGKNTLVVKLGNTKAKTYHFTIIVVAFLSFVAYLYFLENPLQYISLIGFIPLFIHLVNVKKNTNPKALDPELKKVALSTFAIALLHIILSIGF